MSTVAASIKNTEQINSLEVAPKLNWFVAGLIFLLGTGAIVVLRWYQQVYSFEYGLDYFEPDFATYWMSFLYIELALIIGAGTIGTLWVWFTRPDEITMTAHQELKCYMALLTGIAGFGVLAPVVASLFVEADAAWHQVTIRDTDFTPTHILLFYGVIPAGLAGGVVGFLWVHTRMPDFRNRVSFNLAFALAGGAMIMPNLGFNEWGHTFFYAEELFAAPIHWGFVTLGWATFAIGGLVVQILSRMAKLTRVISDEKLAGA